MTNGSTRTLAALAILCCPMICDAQGVVPQPHVSTGVNVNPDQFHAGLHFPIGARFKPEIRTTVEFGLGNGVRLVGFSGDALYHFGAQRWRPYLGGGPGVNVIDVTNGVGEADGMTTSLVAHAVAGIGWTPGRGRQRYFLESRFGVGDTPDVRISLGMSF